jgi:hypothetical protein
MGYGAPLKNQNKGYAAQEKKDLGKMPGAFKQMTTGSWMSQHVSSPLAMGKAHGMQPKMESSEASPANFTSSGDKKKKEKNVAKPPKKKLVASKLSERKQFEEGVNKSFISDVRNKGLFAAVKENFKF